MSKFTGYRCSICKTEYQPGQVTYTCPQDGGNLDIILDYEGIREKYRTRRHHQPGGCVPVEVCAAAARFRNPGRRHAAACRWLDAGLQDAVLAEKLGLQQLWLKDESRNPTASFKDRAIAIVVARAREIKAEVVVTASTGNAGAALAGMSAAVGQKAVIFAPKSAPPAKVAQLLVFGAKVMLVDGTYDDAFDLTIKAAQEFGWYCRNTGYNPFTAEGKKTAAFEIWEYMQDAIGTTPFTVFVSVGDGNIISGIHKGFKDLLELGWIESMPRIIGVQADGSAAIANAFRAGTEEIVPVSATTLADSISVDLPRDGVRAVRAARDTGGTYITVSDEEILSAIAELGKVGVFAEPAGATSYAGLVKAAGSGVVGGDDPILVLNTGSGLKDVKAAMQAVVEAPVIEPTLEAVKKLL